MQSILSMPISGAWKNLSNFFRALENSPRDFPMSGKTGRLGFQSLEGFRAKAEGA
jgi:hypothetical protein